MEKEFQVLAETLSEQDEGDIAEKIKSSQYLAFFLL